MIIKMALMFIPTAGEGEKVLRGHFLITVVLLLRDLFRHLQGGTLGGSLDS